MERRETKNAALRELVDALKGFVEARDRLWSFDLADCLFYRDRRRDSLRRYDDSLRLLTAAIEGLLVVARGQGALPDKDAPHASLLSHDEFKMLLGEPSPDLRAARRGRRCRKRVKIGPRNSG